MVEQSEKTEATQDKRKSRTVSKYSFPYYDLETCIGIAATLHDRAGGKANMSQLAPYAGHKDEFSGAFRSKVWSTQMFGLVSIKGPNVTITPLGEQLASSRTGIQRDKRLAEAFLNVPLFREVFKRYENSTLPSTREGIKESLQKNFGVPASIVSTAVKTLELSAVQAGFKREDSNRLVHPVPAGLMEPEVPSNMLDEDVEIVKKTRQGSVAFVDTVHPAINGFLQALPSKEQRWTESERERWINAFNAMIKALYPTEDE